MTQIRKNKPDSSQASFTRTEQFFLGIALVLWLLAGLNAGFGLGIWGLTVSQFTVICLFASSLLLWLFVALDWPSLLCILGLGFLPEFGFKTIISHSFGHSTFAFLLLTFIVTYGLNQTSILKRLTASVIQSDWIQAKPQRFILAMLLVFLALAMIFSPSVLFMFVFPIYEEVCQIFKWQKGDKSASHLLIAVFSTLAIGTAMTPINHVFAITAMEIYQTVTKSSLTYGQYMLMSIPIGLLIFAVLILSLKWMFRLDLDQGQLRNLETLQASDQMSGREKWVGALFAIMVALWLLPELSQAFLPGLASFLKKAGLVFPPLLITIILAIVRIEGHPLLDIPQALQKGVHWPSLFLVSATLVLGWVMASPDLGLIDWVNQSLDQQILSWKPYLLVLLFITWAGIQTNLSSNLVTVTMVGTLAMTLLNQTNTGIHLGALASGIGFMASLAMMTPPAMPYVAISIGSGWTTARDSFIMGLWLLVWSILFMTFLGYPLGQAIM